MRASACGRVQAGECMRGSACGRGHAGECMRASAACGRVHVVKCCMRAYGRYPNGQRMRKH
eukprot:1130133-Pleurochrysis_carterae.AAC.1